MSPIRYTVSSLEAMIVRTGIGSDSMRSLSLAMYSVEYVLKTLPKAPRNVAIIPISAKYSQSSSAAASGPHIVNDRNANIPPSMPTMITMKKMK